MKPYYARREEFTIEENCFLWGIRTIIPSSLRSKVSLELRNSHPGIVKMKSLARIHVWWPNTDAMIADIEVLCRMSVNGFKPIISFVHPWSWRVEIGKEFILTLQDQLWGECY